MAHRNNGCFTIRKKNWTVLKPRLMFHSEVWSYFILEINPIRCVFQSLTSCLNDSCSCEVTRLPNVKLGKPETPPILVSRFWDAFERCCSGPGGNNARRSAAVSGEEPVAKKGGGVYLTDQWRLTHTSGLWNRLLWKRKLKAMQCLSWTIFFFFF